MAATPKSATKRRGAKRKTPTTPTPTPPQPHQPNHQHSTLIPGIVSALSEAHSFLLTHDLHLLPSHAISLESSLSSASLSLSKLQSSLHVEPQIPRFLSPHGNSWFERFLLSLSSDEDRRWVHAFRMSKPNFFLLNSTISDSIAPYLPTIPPNFALGAALYRLAHNVSFSFVGRRFGLTSADACRAFYAVCKVICDRLGGYLGGFESELERIMAGFERISLPNCCGVLGIEKFPVEGELLGNNGFLMVQSLVDSDGMFLDVSAGWPSMFKPDLILRQTRLFLAVEESKELLNGSQFDLIDGNSLPQYILGDSCFPLLPWLLSPFHERGEGEDLSLKEREFNNVHKKAMEFVSMAFRKVRANWKLLNRKWKEECVEFLPFIIITACLLNNFLMKHGETLPDEEPGCVEEQEMAVYDGEVIDGAAKTRDLLASHLKPQGEYVVNTTTRCGSLLTL